MTDRSRKQIALLGALVAVFVGVLFVRSRGEGPAVPSGVRSNSARPAADTRGSSEVADVRLEALKQEREEMDQPERNLFVFRQKAAAPPPRAVREAPPVAAPSPVPTGPPPPAPIPLKFIGVLDAPGSGKVAILSDGRGNTFHAREGQDVDGRYMVLKIGTESLEMAYTDGRGRQTLRLSGQ